MGTLKNRKNRRNNLKKSLKQTGGYAFSPEAFKSDKPYGKAYIRLRAAMIALNLVDKTGKVKADILQETVPKDRKSIWKAFITDYPDEAYMGDGREKKPETFSFYTGSVSSRGGPKDTLKMNWVAGYLEGMVPGRAALATKTDVLAAAITDGGDKDGASRDLAEDTQLLALPAPVGWDPAKEDGDDRRALVEYNKDIAAAVGVDVNRRTEATEMTDIVLQEHNQGSTQINNYGTDVIFQLIKKPNKETISKGNLLAALRSNQVVQVYLGNLGIPAGIRNSTVVGSQDKMEQVMRVLLPQGSDGLPVPSAEMTPEQFAEGVRRVCESDEIDDVDCRANEAPTRTTGYELVPYVRGGRSSR